MTESSVYILNQNILPSLTNEFLFIIYCIGRMYRIAYSEITCGTEGVISLFGYCKIREVLILARAASVIRAQRKVLGLTNTFA